MKTKTILLFAVLFFAAATASLAQKGFYMEINGEAKNSMGGDHQIAADLMASTPSYITMESKFSLRGSVGADFLYFFNDKSGVSFGLHYSGVGQDYDDHIWSLPGAYITAERSVSLHYLDLPLQYRYVASPANKISFIMAAGFYVGFLLNYEINNTYRGSDGSLFTAEASGDTYTLTLSDQTGSQTQSGLFVKRPWESSDAGGILSAGLQVRLSDKMFLPVMLKYQVGFGNVKNKSSSFSYQGDSYLYWEDDFYPNLNSDYNNSSVGLKIGLRFVP